MGTRCATELGLHTVNCGECGGTYAISERYHSQKRRHGGFWTCPYCKCGWGFAKGEDQTEAEKLRRELERNRAALDAERGRAIALERQRDRVSTAYRKIRERVRNGVCPCCNRTFQNLLRHMKTQHADMDDGGLLRALRDAYGLTQSALAEELNVSAAYISRFENSKPLPDWVTTEITQWMEK